MYGQIRRAEIRSLRWSDISRPAWNPGSFEVRNTKHLLRTAMTERPSANECFLKAGTHYGGVVREDTGRRITVTVQSSA
jgi:hypothetical protein